MKKLQFRLVLAFAFVGAFAAWSTPAMASIVNAQTDDFQDGTTMNWTGGASPTNVSDGGPAGVGDSYLELTATGGGGPGSKIASYNFDQWSGNYTSASVYSIDADVRNFGPASTLQLRVLLFGAGGHFTSTLTTPVANDGLWHHITFGLTASDLTAVDGASNVDLPLTLASVDQLMIRHQSGAPGGQFDGTSINGQLGLDNITAVPEPATLGLLVLGGVALWRRRR